MGLFRGHESALALIAVTASLMAGCGGGGSDGGSADRLVNGRVTWDLENFETSEYYGIDPLSIIGLGTQRLLLLRDAESDVVCSAQLEVHTSELGLETAFNQFASDSDVSFLSMEVVETQYGLAIESYQAYTRSNGENVNALGLYSYFISDESIYDQPLSLYSYCSSSESEYNQNEQKIRNALTRIVYLKSAFPEIEDSVPVDNYESYVGTDAGIKKLFTDIQTLTDGGDPALLESLIKGLTKIELEDLELILNTSISENQQTIEHHLPIYANWHDLNGAPLFSLFSPNNKPERTQINVHRASTEQLTEAEIGSTAYNEFPSGIINMAIEGRFQTSTNFYVIEMVEPGESQGSKWHMFSYTPRGWKFFSKLWEN